MSKPLAYHELPAKAFPLILELFELDDHELARPVWRATLRPRQAVVVPGLGRAARARVTTASGAIHITPPLPSLS